MAESLKEILRNTLDSLNGSIFREFKNCLRDQGQVAWKELEKADTDGTVDLMVKVYSMGAGDVMVAILKKMNYDQLVMDLERDLVRLREQWFPPGQAGGYGEVKMNVVAQSGGVVNAPTLTGCTINGPLTMTFGEGAVPQGREHPGLQSILSSHKLKMEKRVKYVCEGMEKKNKKALEQIYTKLYIVEGKTEGVNDEHEVWQLEATSRSQTTEEKIITCNDIFKSLPEEDIRTVLTMGVAGIGKTVSVQKFILDWAQGKANQDVAIMLMLTFRELNLVNAEYSLHNLLCDLYPELKKLPDTSVYDDYKTVIIFDGLDESRSHLDFHKEIVASVTQSTSVDVLITSIIRGKLLPSALVWITSRPAAINQIPSEYVDQVTEVRGFTDAQKEEYFRRRIDNELHANKIVSHIKTSRTLYIMCHIPVFCWILATVMQKLLTENQVEEMPKTVTEMYIHFLLFQTSIKNQKYHGRHETNKQRLLVSHRNAILNLAKLAFIHLENGRLMFYEEDLRDCGIEVTEDSVYSGMCAEILKEDSVFFEKKVYCFVHLTIQEFLAALFLFHSYTSRDVEVIESFLNKTNITKDWFPILHIVLKKAMDKALDSKNGHLDLFLRFLVGISVESNQALLEGLLEPCGSSMSINTICEAIKGLNMEDLSPDRCVNLLHCLFEMNDHSLLEEAQKYFTSPESFLGDLSPSHCSALARLLLMSEEVLDEFNLKKYKTSDEGERRLMAVVRCCKKALLSSCKPTAKSCDIVASALQSAKSPLIELDLSYNDLQESGEKILSGVHSRNCQLETLRVAACNLTEKSCEFVVSALQSANSHLKVLDLSHNGLQNSEALLAALRCPTCKLESLRLAGWKLTGRVLALTLQEANCHLRELDISDCELRDCGGELPRNTLSRDCKVRLISCRLNHVSCEVMASVLKSCLISSQLSELDISGSDLQTSEERLFSSLGNHKCQLEKLRLVYCKFTAKSCEIMNPALHSLDSLTELDLSENDLSDSGIQCLFGGLKDKDKLQTLRLSGCLITQKGCSLLVSALKSNLSPLKELDLSYNHPGDAGVRELTEILNDPNCNLQIFRYDHEGEFRMKPGLRKYACELTLDPNTAEPSLSLSEGNRKVARMDDKQLYPDHLERFFYHPQVLCREGLSGRCYWEAEWTGDAGIAVTYKSIPRKMPLSHKKMHEGYLGLNSKSWSLNCTNEHCTAWHNDIKKIIPAPSSRSSRVGVYLDWPAGTLSFYSVSSDTLTHLHTFHSTFTEPLYPGFYVYYGSSVSLCQIT